MALLCYRRHRFPPEIIQHAIWLYLRFTLSYRDVEELLAERGLDISYETVRRWVLKFGPVIARRLRRRRPRPSDRWHLDEMVVRIAGKRMYLWRAVDDEGEVLDMLASACVWSGLPIWPSTKAKMLMDPGAPSTCQVGLAGCRCWQWALGFIANPHCRFRPRLGIPGEVLKRLLRPARCVSCRD